MPWPSTFTISHAGRTVVLNEPPAGVSLSEHANLAFQQAVDVAIDNDIFTILHKTHSEYFKVMGAREPVQIERFAAPLFGIATRGAHMTAYVRNEGSFGIWVARRNRNLFTYPGLLDSTVAGGVKASDTPHDCILAESVEEASLDPDYVARNLQPAGTMTLANRNIRTDLFHAEVIYVYDLEMPMGMVPKPGDDEVEEFCLMDVQEVIDRMVKREFKPNVCNVMIDFLVRHGVVKEGEPDFEEICARLRRRIPMPTSPGMPF